MVVPAGQLRDVLGVREVHYLPSNRHLAVVDHTLSGNSPDAAFAAGEAAARAHATAASGAVAASAANEVTIDNFAFNPKIVSIASGSKLSWRNRDDVPHRVQSTDNRFAPSPVLDTKATYSVSFPESGEFPYFCSIHPVMQGKVVVTR
jgi:plastocyanin